jgi:DNA-nicking Smr family endonuclease
MRLSSDDIGLWRRAVRDVRPLPGRTGPPDPERRHSAAREIDTREPGDPLRGKADIVPAAPSPPPPARTHPHSPLDRFAGLDRASAERLKRGRYPVEARLDLHGMTQAEAHRALTGFVARARGTGRRCVLVITGHGRISGGILKSAVPRWLGEPEMRRHLLAITPAQPRHGGTGALYLLLRKASQSD